jgi:hypothetical protein
VTCQVKGIVSPGGSLIEREREVVGSLASLAEAVEKIGTFVH